MILIGNYSRGVSGWNLVTANSLATLAPFYSGLNRPLADLNAAMMVAWRDVLNLRYRIEDGVLYVLGTLEDSTWLWGPPLGRELLPRHIARGLELCVMAGGQRGILYLLWDGYPLWEELQASNHYRITPQATEYVYGVREVAELDGRQLRKLRQAAERFKRECDPKVEAFTPAQYANCIDLLDRWADHKRAHVTSAAREKLELELQVCRLGLEEGLGMEGIVVRVGERIEAFSIGVPHGHSCFNCMFEKANSQLVGAAAFVFRALARELLGRFDEINAGEDWGVGYLATAKAKWRPSRIELSFELQESAKEIGVAR